MVPFEPLIQDPHWLTIIANFWPTRLNERRFPVRWRLVTTEPGVQVLVLSQRPRTPVAGEAVLVHGLEGSAHSRYMRSMTGTLLAAGYVVHRFHMRSCGGTESLCHTFYHGGLTSDLLAVLRTLEREGSGAVHLIGYSLGANVALKLAGELGESGGRHLRSVCAVSTPLDLAASADQIARPENRVFERRFLRDMTRRLRTRPGYEAADPRQYSSVREFDDRYTAPSFGFATANEYYRTQSASRFLHAIRVPSLLIQAKDDPFIPFSAFAHPALRENPCLRLMATEHGGHVGFIARRHPRLWLEHTVVEWLPQAQALERQPQQETQ